MSMNLTKPSGYFRREVDAAQLGRFMAYGLPVSPTPPGAITGWAISAGDRNGRVVFSVPALPDPGDLSRFGDGLGVIVDIAWRAGGFSGMFPLIAGMDSIVDMPTEAWGAGLAFTVSAVSAAGAGPASAPLEFTVPFTPPSLAFPYIFPLVFG